VRPMDQKKKTNGKVVAKRGGGGVKRKKRPLSGRGGIREKRVNIWKSTQGKKIQKVEGHVVKRPLERKRKHGSGEWGRHIDLK